MKKNVSRWWLYATVLLVFCVASLVWERHQTFKSLKNVFHYSYRVTFRDSKTGEILRPMIDFPPMSSSDLFAQTSGTVAYEDGSMRIHGVAYTPRTYTFGLPGYKSEQLAIGPDSPFTDNVKIDLKLQSGPGN